MSALAHSQNSQGHYHSLVHHLEGVSRLAQGYANKFGAGELAYWVGLWHDLGKFDPEFQKYIANPVAGHGPEHSSGGAILAYKKFEPLAFVIAGHHGGLPDREELKQRLRRKDRATEDSEVLSRASRELNQIAPDFLLEEALPAFLKANPQKAEFELFIRMLFSALVDADFLDTEKHFQVAKSEVREGSPSMESLWQLFEAHQNHVSGQKQDSLNQIRHEIYQACLQAATMPPGIFRLTVPTGGGKTLSGMAFALKHALAHHMDRVIVAIPYTSIIEQTTDVYRHIFGVEAVLEHHSAVPIKESAGSPTREEERARLATENWDVPIVVTTNVQLFESLFSNRTSRCRKLHNIARSVVILDEVQTLPTGLLMPILDVLQDLADHYGVTVVLCSATQPAFEDSPYVKGLRDVREVIPHPERYFNALRRVRYELPKGEEWSWEKVANKMHSSTQCLAVVNTKKDALALLDVLDDPNALHLSTLLCAAHRREVLEEVRTRLREGQPCRLVATQVVEAGVDLNFPVVLRAIGPLDRIVQAAGRCNREGLLDMGRVIIFTPSEGTMPLGVYRTGTDTTRSLVAQENIDLHSPTLYQTYFKRLYQGVNLDSQGIQKKRADFKFQEVAHSFRLIDEDTVPAVVRYQSSALKDNINALLEMACRADVNLRWLLRRLQPYIVNVRAYEVPNLESDGLLAEILPSLYEWRGGYDQVRGIVPLGLRTEDLVI